MNSKNIIYFLTAALLVIVMNRAVRAADPLPVLSEYFDMLESSNLETALMMWTEENQERSSRFSIEYLDIPLKIDCSSPIVQNLELMRRFLYQPVRSYESLDHGAYASLEFSKMVGADLVEYTYYVKESGDYYWLIYPQDYFGRTWPVRESRYFRIHYHPDIGKYLNDVLLEEADRFVENTAKTLNISSADVAVIADKKIEYYYCDSDETVKEITGQTTKGMFDLPSNDIISANFPHFHELLHFLINYRLRRLPLFTLPIIQEGMAVYYGGRWGKKPSALFDLGIYIYREGFIDIDSILTYRGFHNYSGADISYPVAEIFTAFLIDRLGQDKMFELYLTLSGKYRELDSLSVTDIQAKIMSATGHEQWTDLIADFNKYLDHAVSGEGAASPGKVTSGKVVLEGSGFKVTEDKTWLAFEFTSPHDKPLRGSLFFGYDQRLAGQHSPLFEEQYSLDSLPFNGYRFGVRFDRNEAGYYDYGTSELVAKFIWGITPLEGYYNEADNTITIRFKKAIIGEKLPDFTKFEYLPL
ncbi:MAG: hypothetical protein ACOYVF_00095 [Candidatus Zixiibacteriota bacterium]